MYIIKKHISKNIIQFVSIAKNATSDFIIDVRENFNQMTTISFFLQYDKCFIP